MVTKVQMEYRDGHVVVSARQVAETVEDRLALGHGYMVDEAVVYEQELMDPRQAVAVLAVLFDVQPTDMEDVAMRMAALIS